MGYLGLRFIWALQGLTVNVLSAVISGIFISLFSIALYLIYGHQKFGSMIAFFIGILGLTLNLVFAGFYPSNIIENLVLIGLSYLEYKRVKEIENFSAVSLNEETQ